ncbi:hypothetical protein N9K77_00725 [bacterium]|nr:hypothetical protein [bacterium]
MLLLKPKFKDNVPGAIIGASKKLSFFLANLRSFVYDGLNVSLYF